MNPVPTSRLGQLDGSCGLPLDRPFTYREARDLGCTTNQLRWMVKRRLLRNPIRGVYWAWELGDSLELRCAALLLVVPEDCVVVDRHAGWLLGAEMVLAPGEHLEVRPVTMFRPSGMGRLRNDLADSGERNLTDEDITEVNGLRVTTPLRTAWDLGRVRHPDHAIAGIDAMLRLGVDRDEFLSGFERFKGMRWITTLRAIGLLGDGRAESPGESVLRLRWIQAQLPEPQPQVEVWRHGILIAILDIANEDLRYAAEYDGDEWHSSDEQKHHDRIRREDVSAEDYYIDAFTAKDLWGKEAHAESRLLLGAKKAQELFGRRAG